MSENQAIGVDTSADPQELDAGEQMELQKLVRAHLVENVEGVEETDILTEVTITGRGVTVELR